MCKKESKKQIKWVNKLLSISIQETKKQSQSASKYVRKKEKLSQLSVVPFTISTKGVQVRKKVRNKLGE